MRAVLQNAALQILDYKVPDISPKRMRYKAGAAKPPEPRDRGWALLSFHSLCHRLLTTPTGRTASLSGRSALCHGGFAPDLPRAAYLCFSSTPLSGSLAKEMTSQL